MEDEFIVLKQIRENTLKAINDLNISQLNKIPVGFNNNIMWNAAHMLVVQQGLCYSLAAAENYIPESISSLFKKGTKPEIEFSEEQFGFVKANMMVHTEKLKTDYNSGLLNNYKPYSTSFGVELKSIESAIKFLNMHEGLHLGYIMALKHAI